MSQPEDGKPPLRRATTKLVLLCTNDTHSKHDTPEAGDGLGGLARRATYLRAQRARHDAQCVYLDCGDAFMGSHYFTFGNGETEMKAFAELGCTATCIGNHEFDGRPFNRTWWNVVQQHRRWAPGMALLSANMQIVEQGPEGLDCGFIEALLLDGQGRPVAEGALADAQAPVVAVVGLLGASAWDCIPAERKEGIEFVAPKVAAARTRARLEALPGGDRITAFFCLSHAGVSRGDRELAATDVFDAIQSGHEHHEDLAATAERISPSGGKDSGGCLLHQGVWGGWAVVRWELEFDSESGALVGIECAVDPIDARYAEDAGITQFLTTQRGRFEEVTSQELASCSRTDLTHGVPFEARVQVGTLLADLLRAATIARWRPSDSAAHGSLDVVAIIHHGGIRAGLDKGVVTWGHVDAVWPWNAPPVAHLLSRTSLARLQAASLASAAQPIMTHAVHFSSNWDTSDGKHAAADEAVGSGDDRWVVCACAKYTVDMVIVPVLGREALRACDSLTFDAGMRDLFVGHLPDHGHLLAAAS